MSKLRAAFAMGKLSSPVVHISIQYYTENFSA